MSPQSTILLAAVITEGLLIVVSYLVMGLWDLPLTWGASFFNVAVGALAVAPPMVLNETLWRAFGPQPQSVYGQFIREIVIPLCKQVQATTAIALSILSGFGEELFFRGVLHEWTTSHLGLIASAILTSFLFSYVHFIGQVKRFGKLLPLYAVMGLYLWFVCIITGSLVAAVVAHGLYNFSAILITRRRIAVEARAR